ncbi:MAG: hypothetical protein O4859_24805 [Trichodesmium sp. St18_bin1]|nr:hypothetical protein [Trichodesmium sp. St18_bin1]
MITGDREFYSIVILNKNKIFFRLKYFHSKKYLSQSKVELLYFSIPLVEKKIRGQIYSNPILFVAKILLLFRQQARGKSQQVKVSTFLSTF